MYTTRAQATLTKATGKRETLLEARRSGWMSMSETTSLTKLWNRPSRPSGPSPLKLSCLWGVSFRPGMGSMYIGLPKSLGPQRSGARGQLVLKGFAALMASTLTRQGPATRLRSCALQSRTIGKVNYHNCRFDFFPLAASILVTTTKSWPVLLSLFRARRRA